MGPIARRSVKKNSNRRSSNYLWVSIDDDGSVAIFTGYVVTIRMPFQQLGPKHLKPEIFGT